MAEIREWALLAYRLPREPSTPRINLWRKLRRMGAVQIMDGLVGLPASPKTTELFGWLADEVEEQGGDAWTFTAVPGNKLQQKVLTDALASAAAEDYRKLMEEAASLESPGRRTVQRLQRELAEIEARDYRRPRERDQARRAVERLERALR